MVAKVLEKKRELIAYSMIFLIVHMFKITNYYPNWDSMHGITMNSQGMTHFGRWLSGFFSILSHSQYDLQWVEGVTSAIFFSILILILQNMFEIKEKNLAYLSAIMLAVYPCVAATLCYSLWSSAYMVGILFAVAGVYLNLTDDVKSFVLSIACFTLSMAVYQIFITVSVIAFFYYIGCILLRDSTGIKKVVKMIFRFFLALLIGAVFYYIGMKISLLVYNIELDSYQGISGAGVMSLSAYFIAFKKMISSFLSFFIGGYSLLPLRIYTVLNLFAVIVIIIQIIYSLLLNKRYKRNRVLLSLLCFSVVCPVTYSFYLISPDVSYHRVMEWGNFFVYFLIILFLNLNSTMKNSLNSFAILIMLLLCVYNFYNDNIAYHQLSMAYQRSEYAISEVLMDVDHIMPGHLDAGKDSVIAIIGDFPGSDDSVKAYPDITGASTDVFLDTQYHFIQFAEYYFGRTFIACTDDKIEEIKHDESFLEMPEYPSEGYVRKIDDVIVVKMD